MRLFYRARQLWVTVAVRPPPAALAAVPAVLSPPLMELFCGMQPGEQVHALQVLGKLQAQGETDADLLAAALLHDAGKQRCALQPWERVLIVLAQAACPKLARRWGHLPENSAQGCEGWRRPFVAAAQHAEWGAEMALQAGASPQVAALIRRHPYPAPPGSTAWEDRLLRKLQAVDDES